MPGGNKTGIKWRELRWIQSPLISNSIVIGKQNQSKNDGFACMCSRPQHSIACSASFHLLNRIFSLPNIWRTKAPIVFQTLWASANLFAQKIPPLFSLRLFENEFPSLPQRELLRSPIIIFAPLFGWGNLCRKLNFARSPPLEQKLLIYHFTCALLLQNWILVSQ